MKKIFFGLVLAIFGQVSVVFAETPYQVQSTLGGMPESTSSSEAKQEPDDSELQNLRGSVSPEYVDQPAPLNQSLDTIVDGGRLTIESYEFVGNTLVNDEIIEAELFKIAGNSLSLESFRVIPRVVQAIYRQQGYLAAARVPLQLVQEGSLRVEVLEARVGSVYLDNQSFMSDRALRARIESQVSKGDPLSLERISVAAERLNQLFGVSARSTLKPGDEVGESDLTFSVLPQEDRVSGQVALDNYGSKSLGYARVGANLSVDSPLGQGNRLRLSTLYSEGLSFAGAAIERPASALDAIWRIGVGKLKTESRTGSEVPDTESEVDNVRLDLTGSAANQIRYKLSYEEIDQDSFARGINSGSAEFRLYSIQLGHSVTLFGQTMQPSITYRAGDVIPDAGSREDFEFYRASLFVQRQMGDYGVDFSWSGQYSGQALNARFKQSLGGSSAVLAYPSGQSSRDIASIVTTSLSRELGSATWTLGYQHAWGKDNDSSIEGELSGLSLAMRQSLTEQAKLRLDLGYRLNDQIFDQTVGTGKADANGLEGPWRIQAQVTYGF